MDLLLLLFIRVTPLRLPPPNTMSLAQCHVDVSDDG